MNSVLATQHIRNNRAIQYNATGSIRGVGYSTEFRKTVAQKIWGGMTPLYTLHPEVNSMVLDLMKTGVARATLTNWVKNYTPHKPGYFEVNYASKKKGVKLGSKAYKAI